MSDVLVDGGDRSCGELLLVLFRTARDLAGGSQIRLIARDPVAEVDLAVWCHLTGHRFLGRVADDTYLVEVSASASPVREDRPWHLAGTEKENR